ncbi:uncharacterized protein [Diadema setosum]|uniref:uncharacterized protein n=1 Tax=Diadema setosum TaxID=31175 RepID=UPI003B3B7CED
MVDQDFRILFENSADALFEKSPKMSARVLEYAEKQVQWKKILNVEDPHSDDEKSNLALQVLPLLFPAGVKKQGKRSVQRATVEESMRAFINVEKLGQTCLCIWKGNKNLMSWSSGRERIRSRHSWLLKEMRSLAHLC